MIHFFVFCFCRRLFSPPANRVGKPYPKLDLLHLPPPSLIYPLPPHLPCFGSTVYAPFAAPARSPPSLRSSVFSERDGLPYVARSPSGVAVNASSPTAQGCGVGVRHIPSLTWDLATFLFKTNSHTPSTTTLSFPRPLVVSSTLGVYHLFYCESMRVNPELLS